MSVGILTIATGRRGYGEMAFNLAASLASFSRLPMAVISDGQFEKCIYANHFASSIHVEQGLNPFQLKTKAFDLSPFDQTLFVDADSLFLSEPERIFSRLNGLEFAFMEYHRHSKTDARTHWIGISALYNYYGWREDQIFPEYNSSVFYFRKTEAVRKFFEAAQYFYSDQAPVHERVGQYYPDEVAFGAASLNTGMYSEIPLWQPAYLQFTHDFNEAAILANYPIITMSGGNQSQGARRLYNSVCAKNSAKLNIKHYPYEHTVRAKAYLNG